MRRAAVLLAVLASLAGGACHSGGSTPASGTSTTTTLPPATWSSTGPAPVTKLVAVDDRIVYLGGTAGALSLVGLDATNGSVAWKLPAVAPALLPGARPSVLADDGAVLALDTPTSLSSIDAKDGSVRWRAPLPGPATSSPLRCGNDVCLSVGPAAPPSPSTAALVSLDRDDGHVIDTGHEIGEHVVAIDGTTVLSIVGTELVLARNKAAEAVWRAPLATILGASAAAPDQLRWRAWPGPGDDWVVSAGGNSDVALGVTAGIDDKGVVTWRLDGSRPCPNIDDDTSRDGNDSLPVLLCTGSPTAAIVAVDPTTGSAHWQLDAPGFDPPVAAVRTSGRSWLFESLAVPIEVDIDLGPRRPGDDVTDGWCGVPDPYPCTIFGQHEATPEAVPAFAGVMAGGWGAWIDAGTVKAVQLP